ncbi:hypothetical protein [Methylobacterium sp. ID0610]|uniref:hypothetical protein n=1 Tax=Methylobacterium carpenticola TaxID=3344827 RepID=UPI0036C353D9
MRLIRTLCARWLIRQATADLRLAARHARAAAALEARALDRIDAAEAFLVQTGRLRAA